MRRAAIWGMTALVGGLVVVPAGAGQADVLPAEAGLSAATAAGSCWEIKQLRPTAADGAYWLLTPSMSEPQQFYCDMTTDGGGWVLVGKGRSDWTTDYEGKGNPSALLTPDTSPMGHTTHQLSSEAIDELLDGGRVDALSEGVRIRRARNTTGTQWQEVRLRFQQKDGWSWTFGAEHRLAGWSFDGSNGTGGTATSFGSNQSYNRVVNTTDEAKGYKLGFAYGSSVTGSSATSSYLWTASEGGRGALPYAQVFLRPRITSGDSDFRAIPDAGTAADERPQSLRSAAMVSPWGVTGLAGNSSVEGNVEVQAFTESGGKMYVGGNFRYVQRDANGTGRVEQPFLAAFDVATGEWVSSFRPELDEQVDALATLPDGTVVAGGTFTRANGATVGALVALDPVTGATRTDWNAGAENRNSAGVRVRDLEVRDGWVYVGGNFTHLYGGPNGVARYARMLGRVAVSNGSAAAGWNPNLNGTVVDTDVSDDGTRIYAAGHFSASNGSPARNVVSVDVATGTQSSPAWTPTWSTNWATYQQAVADVGDRVYVGGSEHSLFGFSTSTFQRLTGSITKDHGDFQAATVDDRGLLYAGCHCADFSYDNAYGWPTLTSGWTEAHSIGWFGIWDGATGARLPHFRPTLNMRSGSGIWALQVDSLGNVWAGGDMTTAQTTQGNRWSGGFARFTRSDSTAPGRPTSFRVTAQTDSTVSLAWNTVSDAGGGVRYQVLRDDRPIGSTTGNTGSITVPRGGEDRFFVRAIDGNGNIGASTSVLSLDAPPANTPPTAAFTATMDGLDGSFDGRGSTDAEGPIAQYAWDFGDDSTGSGAVVTHSYAEGGTYTVTLTVTDAEGATHSTTRQVVAEAPPTGEPGDRTVVPEGSSWRYRYAPGAPPAGWNTPGFDASAWDQGNAVLGWGAASVQTDIDDFATTSDRPLASYFVRSFELADASRVTRMVVDTVANDGVVVYVNGTEVARSNMPAGTITERSYASSARRENVALANPVVVEVPVGLLRNGTNVIAAETHVNYRGTPDVTFDLSAVVTEGEGPGEDPGEPGGEETSVVVPSDAQWSYRYEAGAPDAGWNTRTFDASGWDSGNAVLGFGSTDVDTDIDEFATNAERPLAAYFTRSFQVDDASAVTELVIDAVGDDGVVVYVNGVEVGRENMRDGEVTFRSYAASSRRRTVAQQSRLVVEVPTNLLVDGRNVVAAETHLNYRGTPDMSFDLEATMTTGGDGGDGGDGGGGTEESSVVVPSDAQWSYRYEAGAPDAGWNTRTFDASGWDSGNAVLGFGSTDVDTDIDEFATNAERPLAAYFTRSFQVDDASAVTELVIDAVGDDGVVVYVNGVEVGRENMRDGEVTFRSYAASSRRRTVAQQSRLVVEVPT
ncbi:fibrinogen-like YCDxxxxGGGW domain-containing protein, partial [Nocardioides caldifontis]|uniref:fibrinogen-like YCDxxxxGGGW domain-containing protein n=1 Tax=Nocardioides caldifontis TaxID=2588938 RepID=UPI0011DF430B